MFVVVSLICSNLLNRYKNLHNGFWAIVNKNFFLLWVLWARSIYFCRFYAQFTNAQLCLRLGSEHSDLCQLTVAIKMFNSCEGWHDGFCAIQEGKDCPMYKALASAICLYVALTRFFTFIQLNDLMIVRPNRLVSSDPYWINQHVPGRLTQISMIRPFSYVGHNVDNLKNLAHQKLPLSLTSPPKVMATIGSFVMYSIELTLTSSFKSSLCLI